MSKGKKVSVKMMYNTVKVARVDNTGRFNSRYILLGHRHGLMILAKGNFLLNVSSTLCSKVSLASL